MRKLLTSVQLQIKRKCILPSSHILGSNLNLGKYKYNHHQFVIKCGNVGGLDQPHDRIFTFYQEIFSATPLLSGGKFSSQV